MPAGKEALLREVEGYMDVARATCLRVMRAMVATGLLVNLTPDEAEPQAFVDK